MGKEVRKVSSVIIASLLLHPAAAFDNFEDIVRDKLLCSLRLSLGYKPYTPRVENNLLHFRWGKYTLCFSSSFFMKPCFGILSVLCGSAMTSLEGRKGEMRHKDWMALQELSSLLRQWCAARARKGSQAQHKARVAKPELWLQRSGIQGLTLFPERQAITTWKTCNKSLTHFSWDSLFGFWQMSWCPSAWACIRTRTETLQGQLGPRSWSYRTAKGQEGASGKNWGN